MGAAQTDPVVVAIDLGTSGARAALVDLRGSVLGAGVAPIPIHFGDDGSAEEDPREIWDAVDRAVGRALAEAPEARARVVGLICDSQYSSLVPVDARGQALGPLVLYLDARGGPLHRALLERHPELVDTWTEKHGTPATGGDSLTHLLWFRHARPEIYAQAHAFVEPMDFVSARLSGRCSANACSVFPLLVTDNRKGWAMDYCREMWEPAGIDLEKLPPLVAPDALLGPLLPELARHWGLPADAQVVSSMNDSQALAVGTATFDGNHLGLSIGTTMVPITFVDAKASDLDHFLATQPAPLRDRHVVMAEAGLAGKALELVLRDLVYASDALADHSTADPFAALDASAGGVEPGADGLLFLPWLTGSWAPGANSAARGGFLGMTLSTTRAHLVRATLEGIAYQLRWLLPFIGSLTTRDHTEIFLCGGGALSDVWAQILADVCNLPVRQLARPRLVNCRGAAALAFLRLGLLELDGIRGWPDARATYEPRRELRNLYDDLGERFIEVHDRLGPLFRGAGRRNAEPRAQAAETEGGTR